MIDTRSMLGGPLGASVYDVSGPAFHVLARSEVRLGLPGFLPGSFPTTLRLQVAPDQDSAC